MPAITTQPPRNNHLYLAICTLLVFILWAIDCTVHYVAYPEPRFELLPHNANELWMYASICLLLLVLGCFADHHRLRLQEKERDKLRLFRTTLNASNHILNNYLQQMQLFKLEASNCSEFSPHILALFDQIMDETTAEIRKLEALTEPTPEAINKSVYPR